MRLGGVGPGDSIRPLSLPEHVFGGANGVYGVFEAQHSVEEPIAAAVVCGRGGVVL